MTVDLGCGYKITGSESTLNYISVALYEASEYCRKSGCNATADRYKHDRDTIYRALKEKGYYDTIKRA